MGEQENKEGSPALQNETKKLEEAVDYRTFQQPR
jgi:hypothetical protein